jgi:hypothetical protein
VPQSLARRSRVCSKDHLMSCISDSSKFKEEAVLKHPFKVQGCSDLETCRENPAKAALGHM